MIQIEEFMLDGRQDLDLSPQARTHPTRSGSYRREQGIAALRYARSLSCPLLKGAGITPGWESGTDESAPARHGQWRPPAAEPAAAPTSAVVLRDHGLLPAAHRVGLEPGQAVVDHGGCGDVGCRCRPPADRRGRRQLG